MVAGSVTDLYGRFFVIKEVKKMKKVIVFLLVLVMILSISVQAFAHPAVPEQSLGKVNPKAVNGMHTAWGNLAGSGSIAEHVFLMRFNPH